MWDQDLENSYSVSDFEKGADLFLQMMMKCLEPHEALYVLQQLVAGFIHSASDDQALAVETFAAGLYKNMAFLSSTADGNETQH